MDEAASLRDSLRTKLSDLEAKLEAHRRDLLGEFHQYYHDLTRGASPSAVDSIEKELTPSLADNYKILCPSFPLRPPPPEPSQPTAALAESPPPPAAPPVSESPERATTFQTLLLASSADDSDVPGSPRDRDHELQGLFTPSYLPLLSASVLPTEDTPVSPTATTAAAATPITAQQPSVAANTEGAAETGPLPTAEVKMSSDAKQTDMERASEEDRFPGRLTTPPRHRPSESEAADAAGADDANSSASSDKGDSKAPRSALRRSSSIYKSPQSPRRVRFEFMGAEVLPTASPQASETMMLRSSSPAWEGENVTVDSILGDDSEDLGPPVKKTSSSDMLRALSREPLEEDTVWTVVNPDADNTAVAQKMQQVDLNKSDIEVQSGMHEIQQQSDEVMNADEDEDEDEDDDGGLAMKKKKPAAVPVSVLPLNSVKGSPMEKTAAQKPEAVDDADDMFEFEDESGQTSSRPAAPVHDDDEDHDDHDDTAGTSTTNTELAALRSATTVAPAAVPAAKPDPPEPSRATTPRFNVGSVGSYKGRSIIMPVVKDPEVHAKAASIGNFNSFVGGLDGTSGIDPADVSSYRASFMRDGFNGTPRSFTERLMMEDMEAERLKEKGQE